MHQRPGGAARAQEIHEQVEHLRVQDGRRFEMFASRGCSRKNENARPDDGADAQSGQRPGSELLFKPVAGSVGVGNQLVDGLAAEKLILRDGRGRSGRFGGCLCQ